jgi:hypothetical protein
MTARLTVRMILTLSAIGSLILYGFTLGVTMTRFAACIP